PTDTTATSTLSLHYALPIFNVGTGTETSILELHALCAEAARSEHRAPRFAPERPGDLRRSVLDASRAERELSWRAGTILADGLADRKSTRLNSSHRTISYAV